VLVRRATFAIAALAVLLVGAGLFYNRATSNRCLEFGTIKCLKVEPVSSPSDLARGLSFRDSLAMNSGMLFEFEQDDIQCFWMKDMRFAIDMIWLDANGKVVHIKPNATPGSYPAQFCPPQPARYVLEVNKGATQAAGVTIGDQLKL